MALGGRGASDASGVVARGIEERTLRAAWMTRTVDPRWVTRVRCRLYAHNQGGGSTIRPASASLVPAETSHCALRGSRLDSGWVTTQRRYAFAAQRKVTNRRLSWRLSKPSPSC